MDQSHPHHEDDDLLNEVLGGLEDKLNLTADEKDDMPDDKLDEKLEAEYQNLLKNLSNTEEHSQNPNEKDMMDQLTKMMGSMMGQIKKEGNQQVDDSKLKELEDTFSKMQQNPDMDDMANRLLMDFMDKEILEEPLKDAQESYKKLLSDEKIVGEQHETYQKQYDIIVKILEELKVENYSKEKLVGLFEEMQELGDPPAQLQGIMGNSKMMEQNCSIF